MIYEQNKRLEATRWERIMIKRDIIESGLRLIGFWFLITSSISLVSHAYLATDLYPRLKADPSINVGIFGVSSHLDQDTTHEEIMRISSLTLQYSSATGELMRSSVLFLFALYLCKRGGIVIKFLAGKEKENQHEP